MALVFILPLPEQADVPAYVIPADRFRLRAAGVEIKLRSWAELGSVAAFVG
jgi:hypothetical protein